LILRGGYSGERDVRRSRKPPAPPEFEAGFAGRIVAVLGAGLGFGEIGGVGGDFVGDETLL
jgi:hypothetical protein